MIFSGKSVFNNMLYTYIHFNYFERDGQQYKVALDTCRIILSARVNVRTLCVFIKLQNGHLTL